MHFISDIISTFQSVLINIPLNNPLSILYVVLNTFIEIFALFSYGGSGTTGGGILGGGTGGL